MKTILTELTDGKKVVIPINNIKAIYEEYGYTYIEGEQRVIGKLSFFEKLLNKLGYNLQPTITYEKQSKQVRGKKYNIINSADGGSWCVIADIDNYGKQMEE